MLNFLYRIMNRALQDLISWELTYCILYLTDVVTISVYSIKDPLQSKMVFFLFPELDV